MKGFKRIPYQLKEEINQMKRFKRILSLGVTLVVLLGLLLVPAPVSAAGETVTVDAPTSVGAGVHFRVRIGINTVTNLNAYNFDVTYDATKIEIVGKEGEIGADKGVSNGLIGGTTFPISSWGFIPAGTQGTVRVIGHITGATAGVPNSATGSGYLADLHFVVKSLVTNGSSSLTISNVTLSDNTATEITATWTSDSLTINTGLAATFTVSGTEATAGVTTLTFTDTTSGGTSPYTYAWDFDNGTGTDSTDKNPTYNFSGKSDGTYYVKLTATDSLPGGSAGENTDESSPTAIRVYEVPTANFGVNYTVGVSGRTVFTFTDSTSGGKQGGSGSEYTWSWDFENDSMADSALKNPTKTYAVGQEGAKTVKLSIADTFSPANLASKTTPGALTVYCAGDANRTGGSLSTAVVNSTDITYFEHQLMGHSGYTVETVVANDPGDANGDSVLNAQDLTKIELIIMSAGG